MEITLNKKNPLFFDLTFPYKPHLVAAVKMLPGRTYDAKQRTWRVHTDHVDKVVDMLKALGITPSNEILDLKIDRLKKQGQIEAPFESMLPLFDFQKIGAGRMARSDSLLLADVPGLGKSIQTIAALQGLARVLIFCPASLKFSWQKEIEKWSPQSSIQVIHGTKTIRKGQWLNPQQFTIANYELLYHDYEEIKKTGNWDAIVSDEATRISNPRSITSRNLRALKTNKRVALTGTPISNSPIDLWAILDWLRPGSLGNYAWFVNEFALHDEFRNITGYKNLKEFSNLAAPWILRRTKEEVFKDFPPKVIQNIEFTLSKKEFEVYEQIRKDVLENIEGDLAISKENLGIIPVKMLRLKQLTGHLKLILDDPAILPKEGSKFTALCDLLQPIVENGDKVIIFTQFAQMARFLFKEIRNYLDRDQDPMCCIIDGETPIDERQKLVDNFNMYKNSAIMIMTEAGAYGLNMQSASYVVHYDMPWSIAKLMQREDRAHRIGQTKPVTVYNLIAKDTIDEYVAGTLHKKQKVSVELMKDADRMEANGLSLEDIKSILRI